MTSIKTESNTLNKPDNITGKASGGEQLQKQNSKSKKRRPTAASKAVRQDLRAKSQEAKAMREKMKKEAKTVSDKIEAAETTLNYIIVNMYKNETNCKVFKTFHDWKKAGYKVNKGVKGFAVWGTPKRIKDKLETEVGEVLEGESWEFWPLCYLFNESQVTKNNDTKPTEPTKKDDKKTESVTVESEKKTTSETILKHDGGDMASQFEIKKVGGRYSIYKSGTYFVDSRSEKSIFEKLEKLLHVGGHNPLKTIPEADTVDSFENSSFVMANYDERQEEKRERLEERADKKQSEAESAYQRSRSLVENIPFGQPILVGHHSEQRHRNTVDKSWNLLGKSVSLSKDADKLSQRANGVGCGGISSTDPEALVKLQNKYENLVNAQDVMKKVNKIVKSKKLNEQEKIEKILSEKLLKTEALTAEILKPDFASRVGFASYSLSNNNAEIRRTKQRIYELKKLQNSSPIEFENDDFSMVINNGQVVIDFKGGKPNDSTRTLIKQSAFKWSRHQTAWVRKVTVNALASANHLLEQLKEVEEMY